MLFKTVFFCCLFVYCHSAYEGDACSKGDEAGVCTFLAKCSSALEDIKHRKNPQICGFVGADPIVCCVSPPVITTTLAPVATTTKRSNAPTTEMYIPPVYDYVVVGDKTTGDGQCQPIAKDLTKEKTGQKAFDKCIEYQEKCIYPCEKAFSLSGGMTRGSHCHHVANKLIVGGSASAENEFPHMALLGYGDTVDDVLWSCGGTIISERFILTAGHCIGTRSIGDVKFVVVGALTREDTKKKENIYTVKNIIRHPDYQPPAKYNDIALLELEKEIPLSQYIVPACLDIGTANGSKVLATGWGHTEYNGQTSEVMQKVILEQFTTDECHLKYDHQRHMKRGFDADSQTCYGHKKERKDTCQGDSGGPIQTKSQEINCMYIVVGVTSFGRACGFVSEPAIYTRVAHFVPWIEGIVWPDN